MSVRPLIVAFSVSVGLVRALSSSVGIVMRTEKRGAVLDLKVGSMD